MGKPSKQAILSCNTGHNVTAHYNHPGIFPGSRLTDGGF